MSTQHLISQLSDRLEPQALMRARTGLSLVAIALAFSITLVAGIFGLWWAGLTGGAAPIYYIGSAMLLVLGIAAASASVAMASPRVGSRHDGPLWGTAMIAVLPLTALVTGFSQGSHAYEMTEGYGLECMILGSLTGLLVFAALAFWLRRGAPVSVQAAGLFAGIASGALGSFAFGLACPLDGMVHFGLWHVAPVAVCGILGRLVLPRLIRW